MHRVRVELAVVGFFEAERPLRGAAGLVDWRLCGALSRLLRAGRLSGARGDAALIPGGGGLRAARVLVLGLGAETGFEGEARRAAVADAIRRALALRVRSLALSIPAGEESGGEAALDAILRGAHDAWVAAEAGADVSLALVAEPDAERVLTRSLLARAGALPSELRIDLAPERPVERVPVGRRPARTGS